ncbi:NAD(P)/FAD-dependent oxidoreductase [Spirosoma soli]|uniref:NAD(P)/FAD-dependent oxidoreductase n=1 Tax=Spirosoma soli TaxID=1770529 RepID=A0ABW5LZ30_9BACT
MDAETRYDVIIVGGSHAGLSAAMLLGRSLRNVLIVDSGKPCNRQTPHSHNFLTQDGATPAQITVIAKAQVLAYPTVTWLTGLAVNATKHSTGFVVETVTGHRFTSRRLLLATGVEDIMPDIGGFADCWGRSVLHCPFCHGYEVHSQPLGILANGETAYEMVRLIQNWSKSLTLFTNGPAALTDNQRQTIAQLGVPIVEDLVGRLEHEDGNLQALRSQNGSRHELTAIFSRVPFRQHSSLAEQLGSELTDMGLVKTTQFGQTNVPGLYAAGDNSTLLRQVSVAVANGSLAGVGLHKELMEEDLAAISLSVAV